MRLTCFVYCLPGHHHHNRHHSPKPKTTNAPTTLANTTRNTAETATNTTETINTTTNTSITYQCSREPVEQLSPHRTLMFISRPERHEPTGDFPSPIETFSTLLLEQVINGKQMIRDTVMFLSFTNFTFN